MKNGIFTISLDFELFWGVRDHRTIENYGETLKNVHQIVPRLLQLFNQYNVHCTWATVGMLFLNNKQELQENTPQHLPHYTNTNYNPYTYIQQNELEKSYHFAPDLISLIQKYPGQEIATHTYSHYYCLEDGQNIADFTDDIDAAIKIANKNNIKIESIVFPRNQTNQAYLSICKQNGITNYRGNEKHWLYEAKNRNDESKLRRAFRLIDAYTNISGHHTHCISISDKNEIINIPSSRFLRPYSKKLKIVENIRLKRICKSLQYAAKNKQLFHLWWHPHNFGTNMEENFAFLEKIFIEYTKAKSTYGMISLTMNEIANSAKNGQL